MVLAGERVCEGEGVDDRDVVDQHVFRGRAVCNATLIDFLSLEIPP